MQKMRGEIRDRATREARNVAALVSTAGPRTIDTTISRVVILPKQWETLLRTTISQNLRTPRKFFLVVLVLVLVLDWVSGLDCEDEDDDEDDSVAAAPLRARKFHRTRLRPNG